MKIEEKMEKKAIGEIKHKVSKGGIPYDVIKIGEEKIYIAVENKVFELGA